MADGILHKVLDGEASPEEIGEFRGLMDSATGLKKEFSALNETIHLMENCGKAPVPAAFTADVIRKLPARKKPAGKGFTAFLFGERVLRWNMAAALAAAALFVVILGGIVHVPNKQALPALRGSGNSVNHVTFKFHAPVAKDVAVAGDFNKWSLDKGVMRKQQGGLWTLEVPLSPGTYNYMFVVDGRVWMPDPNADAYRDDGFGSRNSIVRVSRL